MKISRERIEYIRTQYIDLYDPVMRDALTAIDERDAKLAKAVKGLGIIVTNLGNLNSFYTAEDVIVFARAVLKELEK